MRSKNNSRTYEGGVSKINDSNVWMLKIEDNVWDDEVYKVEFTDNELKSHKKFCKAVNGDETYLSGEPANPYIMIYITHTKIASNKFALSLFCKNDILFTLIHFYCIFLLNTFSDRFSFDQFIATEIDPNLLKALVG